MELDGRKEAKQHKNKTHDKSLQSFKPQVISVLFKNRKSSKKSPTILYRIHFAGGIHVIHNDRAAGVGDGGHQNIRTAHRTRGRLAEPETNPTRGLNLVSEEDWEWDH